MANFTGTAGDDIITSAEVTAGVIRDPPGSTPSVGPDVISGGDGNDSLGGAGGDDILTGGNGLDSLLASSGDDTLNIGNGDFASGSSGDDVFNATGNLTSGATLLQGGDGIDTFDAQGALAIGTLVTIEEIENLALDNALLQLDFVQLDGFARIVADGGANIGRIGLIRGGSVNIEVTGLDTLFVTGSSGPAPDDELRFNATTSGSDPVPTNIFVDAGLGDDTVNGNVGNSGGDDTVSGGAGDDVLVGGEGDDSLLGGDGSDFLAGNRGDDTLSGGAGADRLIAEQGADLLLFGNADSVEAGSGADTLLASGDLTSGATVLDGSGGVDTFDAQGTLTIGTLVTIDRVENLALDGSVLTLDYVQLDGFTRIVADGGVSLGRLALVRGGASSTEVTELDRLEVTGSSGPAPDDALSFTSAGRDATDIDVAAGLGDDTVTTGAGADTLDGGDGEDRLTGGAGEDLLIGGVAADRLAGGAGSDRFRYDAPSEGEDRIDDFVPGDDRLLVSADGFGGGLAEGAALSPGRLVVHGSNLSTAASGTGQFILNANTGRLLWDADGMGGDAAVRIARLIGVASLATEDFAIIA